MTTVVVNNTSNETIDSINNLNDVLKKLDINISGEENEEQKDSINLNEQISAQNFKYIDKEILKLTGVSKIGDRIKILNYLKTIDSKENEGKTNNDNSKVMLPKLLKTINMDYHLSDKNTINFILNDGSVHSVGVQGSYTADNIKLQLLKTLDNDKTSNYNYPLDCKQFDVFSIEPNSDETDYKLFLLYDVELVTISHSADKYIRKRLIFVPKWETPSKLAMWRCKKIVKKISEINTIPSNKELIKNFKDSYLTVNKMSDENFIRSPLNANQRPTTNLISNNLKSYFPKTSQTKLKSTMITSLKKSYQQSLYSSRDFNNNNKIKGNFAGKKRNSQNIGSILLNDSEKLEKEILKDPDFDKNSTLSRQSLCASLTGLDDDELDQPIDDGDSAEFNIEGKWIKGSKLGSGSYGNVFLGLNSLNGTLMAVKQVPFVDDTSTTNTNSGNDNSDIKGSSEGGNKEEIKKTSNDKKVSTKMVEALSREIDLLQNLNHENIVDYLGCSNEDGFLNIFLEYVPGGSISQMLSSYGPLEESLVRSFLKQILVGISYLHRKDIIHRDIKGANILIDTQGIVKITDFGISTKLPKRVRNQWLKKKLAGEEEEDDDERKASLQGSVYWMAPEVVKQITITSKADIWSIGCVIIEMCTARHPFPEYSQMQALFKIGTNVVPKLPTQAEFEEDRRLHRRIFLSKCMVLDFQRRPNSIELLNNSWLLEEIL
ncbi:Pkinase-domain-containing protein [Hanseniaspora valbyensis NRRL Y-1626]|uniref:Pkinase-domain-containing protein n=1 Tax=Hanseniaspora valbyensis NRRL Y-1626 TaxID=766949 RepID=A0A1B7T7Y2_9ASCO|nr:Pkinase-domain-containing protein [Hanseniaspora valbyensis NRRL Y-1626]